MPKLKSMPAKPEYLRASITGRPVGVDREKKILRGFVVAQLGPFKSDGRGEFDLIALKEIVRLGNEAKNGLKSRFTHPDMSSDGLGKHLGRGRDYSLSQTVSFDGQKVPAVRADLHFDDSAFDTPSGDLAGYVMRLAESDPEAISSSLVLRADQEYRLEKDGTPAKDKNGDELPPLWRPTKLYATDIVDTGDAVDGLLSAELECDNLPLSQLWSGAQILNSLFEGEPRDVVEMRLHQYLTRYLDRRYGDDIQPLRPKLAQRMLKLDRMGIILREKLERVKA